ncbi:YCF48-related protein [Sphaerotilus sp.]|uniref:WD40/YVTN/BNR-like repeat-containing protein n=1 Tax=Sphaerotilus sp. TaxID=2093942 RepID=UPI00286E94D1|nr:YCF48-related protein [Sphaerotilus sp.]
MAPALDLSRRHCVATLAGGLLAAPFTAHAVPSGVPEALARPAERVAKPQDAVLLAAARAGERWVAVGERGLVVTADATARRWTQAAQVPVSTTLTAVRFIDTQRGWAVGHGGVVLSTQDGGEHWLRQLDGRMAAQLTQTQAASSVNPRAQAEAQRLVADGPDKPFLDLYFSSAHEGCVVGAYNLCFQTVDGGAHWAPISERLDNPKALHLYAIAGQGQQRYIAGEQGMLFRSDDAGRSFQRLTSPYVGSWFALALLDAQTLVVAGLRGHAYLSHNGGQQWTALDGAPPVSFVSAVVAPGGNVLLANQAGQLFLLKPGQTTLTPLPMPALPPTQGAWPLGPDQVLVLTAQGALAVPLQKAAP